VFLNRIACLLNIHTARTSKMHWQDDAFVSECRHCGKPLRRVFGDSWKIDAAAPSTRPEPRSSD
jgi:hypothetical protein